MKFQFLNIRKIHFVNLLINANLTKFLFFLLQTMKPNDEAGSLVRFFKFVQNLDLRGWISAVH